MHLLYFPVNAAWAFVFGSTVSNANLCQMYGFDMFFKTKGEAIEAARHRGLSVDLKTGAVTVENPAWYPLIEQMADSVSRSHRWCMGEREIARCPICNSHILALLEASSAKRPFSNILRGDIRTFNENNLPDAPYTPLQLTTQALKDILNAAGNGQPYSVDDLLARFQNDYNVGVEELARQGLPEIA